jgi:hypothetical protein
MLIQVDIDQPSTEQENIAAESLELEEFMEVQELATPQTISGHRLSKLSGAALVDGNIPISHAIGMAAMPVPGSQAFGQAALGSGMSPCGIILLHTLGSLVHPFRTTMEALP